MWHDSVPDTSPSTMPQSPTPAPVNLQDEGEDFNHQILGLMATAPGRAPSVSASACLAPAPAEPRPQVLRPDSKSPCSAGKATEGAAAEPAFSLHREGEFLPPPRGRRPGSQTLPGPPRPCPRSQSAVGGCGAEVVGLVDPAAACHTGIRNGQRHSRSSSNGKCRIRVERGIE